MPFSRLKFGFVSGKIIGIGQKGGMIAMEFLLLAGGLVVILIPVVISVVSAVVSGVAAAVDDEGED